MNSYSQTFDWLTNSAHWTGADGIITRAGQQLGYSAATVLIAVAIAVPIGLFIGHSGYGRELIVPFTGSLRALPTLGLLTVLALRLGIGISAPLIALVILALPPILAGAYAGVEAVDRDTVDAASATGFTGWQVLTRVELPLAAPLLLGGIRSSALQVISTWTVAAFLPVGGLGRFLIDGLAVRDYAQMLGGSVVVIVLALVVDATFAIVQRFSVPRGVRTVRMAGRAT